MATWRDNHLPETVDPVVEAAVKELKENHGIKKIGTVGYCFGAKFVVRFLKKGVTDAGYVAHPSWVLESELKAIEGPLSIAAAGGFSPILLPSQGEVVFGDNIDHGVEIDGAFPAEKRHETEQILLESKLPYQINLYSGVSHGFAVRGDLKNRVAKYAKEQAFFQAVFWFDEHLKA